MRASMKREVYDTDHGEEAITVEFDVDGQIDPGEPMVMYYRDGSGHPGSPPSVDSYTVTITHVSHPDADREALKDYLETDDAMMESIERELLQCEELYD
jgi:hypothetical protein